MTTARTPRFCEDQIVRPDDPALGPLQITIGCANFESVPRDKVKLPKRDTGKRKETAYPFKYVPEVF